MRATSVKAAALCNGVAFWGVGLWGVVIWGAVGPLGFWALGLLAFGFGVKDSGLRIKGCG